MSPIQNCTRSELTSPIARVRSSRPPGAIALGTSPVPRSSIMHLRQLLLSIPYDLARLSSAYLTEASLHEGLAHYPTLSSLLTGLERAGGPSTAERKALIALIVRAHQTKPHRVWSTVLLQVFGPLLKKIRKKLQGGDDDTRDEILLEETQHALLRMRTRDSARIFMYFRQAVSRRVFKTLRKDTDWEELGFGIEADTEPDPKTLEGPQLLGVWLKGFGTRQEQVELLATLMEHGGLQELVERRFPGQGFTPRSKETRF
jgi:hypothetical protein